VTNTVPLEGAQHGIMTTYVFGGQIVQVVADVDAVALNKCSVQYTRGNDTFAGQVPLNALQVVDTVPASIPAPEAPASPAPQP